MRACWMPPRSPAAKLDPLRLSVLHRRPLRRALFICARVRRPAPSRRVMALTVLGSPCVISREGPVGRLRVLATANTPFPVPTCPALHSAGHIGLFVLSAWRPVASPLVTEGVICSSVVARESRSRPSRRFACALWPEFSLNALKKGSIGWGPGLSGRNPEERAFLVRTRALVFCLARQMACGR